MSSQRDKEIDRLPSLELQAQASQAWPFIWCWEFKLRSSPLHNKRPCPLSCRPSPRVQNSLEGFCYKGDGKADWKFKKPREPKEFFLKMGEIKECWERTIRETTIYYSRTEELPKQDFREQGQVDWMHKYRADNILVSRRDSGWRCADPGIMW